MKIYKYTPHIELFLQNSALKLTPAIQLNDPFEAKITDSFIKNIENIFSINFGKESESIFTHVKKSLEENGKYKGLISFSTSTDNLIMLSHYSNDHKGGILEFTIDDIEDGYSNKTNLFKTTNDDYNFGVVKYLIKRNQNASKNYQDHFKTGVMFEKFIEWEYEKEVRYLSDFRGADYYIIPKKEILDISQKILKKLLDPDKLKNSEIQENCILHTVYCSINEKDTTRSVSIKSETENIFNKTIYDYTEDEYNVKFKIKIEDEILLNDLSKWNKTISNSTNYHPMLEVNKECLTAVYLGCNHNDIITTKDETNKFINLKGNILKAKLCPENYSLIYEKIEL